MQIQYKGEGALKQKSISIFTNTPIKSSDLYLIIQEVFIGSQFNTKLNINLSEMRPRLNKYCF